MQRRCPFWQVMMKASAPDRAVIARVDAELTGSTCSRQRAWPFWQASSIGVKRCKDRRLASALSSKESSLAMSRSYRGLTESLGLCCKVPLYNTELEEVTKPVCFTLLNWHRDVKGWHTVHEPLFLRRPSEACLRTPRG